MHKTARVVGLGVLTLLLTSLPATAVTVQYDTGSTSSNFTITGSRQGNEFTNLGGAKTITKVSWFEFNSPGVVNVRFKQSAVAVADLATYQLMGAGGTGFRSLSMLNLMFTGTKVWVGFNVYNTHGVAFDTMDGGFGFHARQAPGGTLLTQGSNPGNFVLRISGPTGLPVELLDFQVR